jgi:hypothetical protein
MLLTGLTGRTGLLFIRLSGLKLLNVKWQGKLPKIENQQGEKYP